jgi:hypothetical protein
LSTSAFALAVRHDRKAAALEHLHHHRRARARQARHDDDRLAVSTRAQAFAEGVEHQSVTPTTSFSAKPATRLSTKNHPRMPLSPSGKNRSSRSRGVPISIRSTTDDRGSAASPG